MIKNLDSFSKRILAIAFAISLIFCSGSLFLFALSTVPKTFANNAHESQIQQSSTIKIDGYTIIGYSDKPIDLNKKNIYAVGVKYDPGKLGNVNFKLFPNN